MKYFNEGPLKCNVSTRIDSCFIYVFVCCVAQFIESILQYLNGTCTFSRATPSAPHCKLLNFAAKWEVTTPQIPTQPPPPKPVISTYKKCHSRFGTQSLCHSTSHWRLRRVFDKRISLSLCNISFQEERAPATVHMLHRIKEKRLLLFFFF